jgi:phosphonate transport system substrate-binding protein
MKRPYARILALAIGVAISWFGSLGAQSLPDGSKARPLRVMLVPADGGTEDGTKADFLPVFNAVNRVTGLNFDIKP